MSNAGWLILSGSRPSFFHSFGWRVSKFIGAYSSPKKDRKIICHYILVGLDVPNLFYLFRVCYTCSSRICQVAKCLHVLPGSSSRCWPTTAGSVKIDHIIHIAVPFSTRGNPWHVWNIMSSSRCGHLHAPESCRFLVLRIKHIRWIPGCWSNFDPRNGESMKNLVEIRWNKWNLNEFDVLFTGFSCAFLGPVPVGSEDSTKTFQGSEGGPWLVGNFPWLFKGHASKPTGTHPALWVLGPSMGTSTRRSAGWCDVGEWWCCCLITHALVAW